MTEDVSITATDELPQSEEPPSTDAGDNIDVATTEQAIGSPAIEEPSTTPMQETVDTSVTAEVTAAAEESAAVQGSRTTESTQESTSVTPTTDKSQTVQDELTTVQESPTKEEALSDMQQDPKESVGDLPASDMIEHITELPTLQEAAPQELQEFTEIITSK